MLTADPVRMTRIDIEAFDDAVDVDLEEPSSDQVADERSERQHGIDKCWI